MEWQQAGPDEILLMRGLGKIRQLSALGAVAAICMLWLPGFAQSREVVALGDSLVAGLGLSEPEAFVGQLQGELARRGHTVSIVNAGVSGDTSAAGLARLDWSIPEGTSGVIVELGANDMLRGVDPAQTRANLAAILGRLQQRKIAVLLVGMRASPNMGAEYAAAFDAIYPDLARQFQVPLYPFFLEGVAAEPAFNQVDGMHPNAEGVKQIVMRFLPAMEAFIAAKIMPSAN